MKIKCSPKKTNPSVRMAFLAVSLVFAGNFLMATDDSTEGTIFHFDFSTFETGPFPYADTGWSDSGEGVGLTSISDYEGMRAFTFDYPPGERTRADYDFSSAVSAEEIEVRFSIRFHSSIDVPDGYNTQFVPTVGLSAGGGSFASDPVLMVAFQSWGRIRMLYRHNGELQEVNYDSSFLEGISYYHGQNYHDDPVEMTLRYNRSTGLVTFSGTSETNRSDWVDYSYEFEADPDMEFTLATIVGSSGNNRSAPENFFQIGHIGLFAGGVPQISNYGDWVAAFLSGHVDELERSDDPGGFGVSNFARYAFALDPLHPFDSALREFNEAEGLLAMSFRRYEGIEDVVYTVESTNELTGEWDSLALEDLATETTSLGDGREEVLVSAEQGETARRFFRLRANVPEPSGDAIFHEDFEGYSEGETPSGEWLVDVPEDTAAFVQGAPGSRYLTMTDVSQEALARVVRIFNAEGAESVSVTFEWYRKTGRGYNNHLGDELTFVPAFYLLQDMTDMNFYGSNIIAEMRLRSWDRGQWLVRDNFDTLTLGQVGSGDFLHDQPFLLRMTYRRVGEVSIEVSKDGFETVEWGVTRDSVPDLDVNGLAVRSSNAATTGTNRLYADPVWEVRSISVAGGEE